MNNRRHLYLRASGQKSSRCGNFGVMAPQQRKPQPSPTPEELLEGLIKLRDSMTSDPSAVVPPDAFDEMIRTLQVIIEKQKTIPMYRLR